MAGIRAGQLGIDTVLVEGDRLGGTCLIRGCIPSKAMIHVASKFEGMAHAVGGAKDGIGACRRADARHGQDRRLEGNRGRQAERRRHRPAEARQGEGGRTAGAASPTPRPAMVETAEGPVTIKAETVILAAGSVAAALPHIPFGGDVISSTEALALPELPKRLAVIGAGYIGLELGSAFRKFGCEVTVVEAQDRILPLYDDALTKPVKTWLEKAGVTLHLGGQGDGLGERRTRRRKGRRDPAHPRRQAAGHRRPPPPHPGLGAGGDGRRHGRAPS